MNRTDETFEIPLAVAEVYEERFVPAIFATWAPVIVAAARVDRGADVLDVACGTGVVARTAADVAGDERVVGVDRNPNMLSVAARIRPDIDWRIGDAGALPVTDGAFDAVTCQMAMMFFPDRAAAFREMARAVRPNGRVAVVVPAALGAQPAYRPFVEIAARHTTAEATALLGTYFACGDLATLTGDAESAGLDIVEVRTTPGPARFASAGDFVDVEIGGSPLAERIDETSWSAVRDATADALDRYTTADGEFEIPLVCHVLSATRS